MEKDTEIKKEIIDTWSIEDVIMQTVQETLHGDEVKKIIRTSVEKGIERAMDSVLGYNGDAQKIIKDKVNKIMVPYLEEYDYQSMLVTLDEALSQLINSCKSQHVALLENFKTIMNPELTPKKITTSEIFDYYKAYVAKHINTYGIEVCLDDEPSYNNVTCKMSVEDKDDKSSVFSSSYDKKVIHFECDEDDGMEFFIPLSRWKSSHSKDWSIEKEGSVSIDKLRYMDNFAIFVARMYQGHTVVQIDEDCLIDEDVEIIEKPEATYE